MRALSAQEAEFNAVRSKLEELAATVLRQIDALQLAAARRDLGELAAIVARDREVDTIELALDAACRSFIERRAPMGPDFRYALGALDVARSLERIGDCVEYVARHIAEKPQLFVEFRESGLIIDDMLDRCREMFDSAFRAWVHGDTALARRVRAADDGVDALQDRAYDLVVAEVRAGRLDVEVGMLALLSINKLESIADIASHIAETVVFVVTAEQIRHEREAPEAPTLREVPKGG